jgi:hypothetical protein
LTVRFSVGTLAAASKLVTIKVLDDVVMVEGLDAKLVTWSRPRAGVARVGRTSPSGP